MKKSILEVDLTDEQFAALSNKTRRDILEIIYDTPRSIAEQLGGNIVYMKRHLHILLECDLIFQSTRGNMRQYQTNREQLSL